MSAPKSAEVRGSCHSRPRGRREHLHPEYLLLLLFMRPLVISCLRSSGSSSGGEREGVIKDPSVTATYVDLDVDVDVDPTAHGNNGTPYNVALLMVRHSISNRFDLVHIGPAIDIAREKCSRHYNIQLNLLQGYYENTCNETQALGKATDLVQSNPIVAFIGPACSDDLQVVGRLASYKGIPLLTGLGDVITGMRSTYTSLIRVSYDLRDEARALLAFLANLHWFKFGLIYRHGDVYYEFLASELLNLLALPEYRQFECTCRESYVRALNKTVLSDLDKMIDTMIDCSRVIVILGGDREVRKMMLIAHRKGITSSGEYAFIYTELFEGEATGTNAWSGGSEDQHTKELLKEAYQALLIVSLHQPLSDFYKNFSDEVKARALADYNYEYSEEMVNYFSASFHDAVILLCRAINDSLGDGEDPMSGSALVARMRNVSFSGISGRVTVGKDGDRIADYVLLDQVDPESGSFEVVLRYYGATKEYQSIKSIHWPPSPDGIKPNDSPACGFDGSGCPGFPFWDILTVALLAVLALILCVSILIYRKVKLEAALANMSWRVKWDEITFQDNVRMSCLSRLSLNSQMSHKMEKEWICWDVNEETQETALNIDWAPVLKSSSTQIVTGFYKGNLVAVKRLPGKRIASLSRNILLELKVMRETSHENLARFIGCCDDGPVAILYELCAKGSLRDLLANSTLNLDWLFRYSLINDIISGMVYLHASEHIYHGKLKSTNCLVDSRFCVKISDFGLFALRRAATDSDPSYPPVTLLPSKDFMPQASTSAARSDSPTLHSPPQPVLEHLLGIQLESDDPYSLLYVAPDLLAIKCKCMRSKKSRERNRKKCTDCHQRAQKGDVYSFAIILQEIILRELPFHPHFNTMSIPDIVSKTVSANLRPHVPQESCALDLHSLMTRCWSKDPDLRPDFFAIKRDIRIIMKSLGVGGESAASATFTEKLLVRMEQYANELESIVEQRTEELAEEKKKTEEILYQILPRSVADQLKKGRSVVPDFYESVTIYFSDIVGFTSMCSESTAMEVVNFLNDLYTCFDSIVSDFDVYKVETIGDAYMVVSGLPDRNGSEHVREVARMSLQMRQNVEHFVIRHRPSEKLKLRIGIHSGPCCAGVVGNKRPRYCLFGDTVNTASRMESTGEPFKIHVSPSSKALLDSFGTFLLSPRGEIDIKGKGVMGTYWLLNEIL